MTRGDGWGFAQNSPAGRLSTPAPTMLLTRLNISLGIVAVPPPVVAAGAPLAAAGSSGRASDDAEDRSAVGVGPMSGPSGRGGDALDV